MTITVKEQHRRGSSANVGVLDALGNVIYNRYVDASEWDSDPEAVTAQIAEYLAKQPSPILPSPSVNKNPVTLTDKQVTDKLAAMEAEKAAAMEAAKPKA